VQRAELVWITGNSGTGKSTVRAELARRGYASFDTDEDGIAVWRDRATGQEVAYPGDTHYRDDWLEHHGWMIDRSRIEGLALLARDRFVFLCGSVENETEVWDLFDRVVCLALDEATLRERILTRTTNAFGKKPVELQAILTWNPSLEPSYRQVGAQVVSASQPLAAVVDEILAYVNA
jgi:predicted ATPase